jgi:hypothetical protein
VNPLVRLFFDSYLKLRTEGDPIPRYFTNARSTDQGYCWQGLDNSISSSRIRETISFANAFYLSIHICKIISYQESCLFSSNSSLCGFYRKFGDFFYINRMIKTRSIPIYTKLRTLLRLRVGVLGKLSGRVMTEVCSIMPSPIVFTLSPQPLIYVPPYHA